MRHHSSRRPHESGNILFLILLAVILFAALSYAVTSSMRGGGKNANNESLQAGVADMLNQFAALDTAVLRMRMAGIPLETISFQTTRMLQDNTTGTAYTNATCLSAACQVFNPAGGGIADRNFMKHGTPSPHGVPTNYIKSGYWQGIIMQWPNAGTTANDIVIQYLYMRPEFCAKLNEALNVSSIPTLGGTANLNIGVPANWDNAAYTLANTSSIDDKSTFASAEMATGGANGTSYCHIYHLLITR